MARALAPARLAFPGRGGGTGDIAFRIVEASRGAAEAPSSTSTPRCCRVGAERAEKRGLAGNLAFVEGNAEDLKLPDDSFDAYTIAFGIRNVPRIDLALAEAYRVLKPGGRFLCLEFSEVDLPVLDKVYDLWSFKAIPRSAGRSRRTAPPTSISWNRSAASPTR